MKNGVLDAADVPQTIDDAARLARSQLKDFPRLQNGRFKGADWPRTIIKPDGFDPQRLSARPVGAIDPFLQRVRPA